MIAPTCFSVSVAKPGSIKSLIEATSIKSMIYPAGIVVAIDASPIVVWVKSKVGATCVVPSIRSRT